MKTSNKLFIAAMTTLILLLVIYDFGLKAEYVKGSAVYTGNDKILLDHKDFDRVRVNSAGVISVFIVPGMHRIEVLKESAMDVKITQTGKLLTVDMNIPVDIDYYGNRKAVFIYMPNLKELSTDAQYTVKRVHQLRRRVKDTEELGVKVQGFTKNFSLDSLTVVQDNGSTVKLIGNKIGYLKTVSGMSTGSKSALNIKEGNQIQAAHFEVRGSSLLSLENVAIPILRIKASDSAQIALTGASSLSLLKK
ncbi:hypothetical protein TH61_16870 [Rufibacter sp. DG15C]|uniref:hypothetical protein n=1 Tax=Rufibacter sp. DG15C TaxID=1379909 RepID=UPI00078C180C|nr:hypothetical protein [Rufibacter sp. DG15C]AMM52518.1 hypothetical protein TH61_16870 [Rufibacter sp. DG15C]